MRSLFLIVGVITLLQSYFIGAQVLSPAERCAATPSLTFVCNDCYNTIACDEDGTLGTNATPCEEGEVCDVGITDGNCVTPNAGAPSPNCGCESTGCLSDPNTNDAYVDCETVGEFSDFPTIDTTCPDTTESTLFNLETCACEPVTEFVCPSCGFIASDIECPKEFYYCASGSNDPLECPDDTCYDPVACSCQDDAVPVICPPCGKYADTSGDKDFCLCGNIDSVVCVDCSAGFSFNNVSCTCVDSSLTTASPSPGDTTTTTTPGDTTSTTTPGVLTTYPSSLDCLSCGLADDPGSDCKVFYSCDPDSGTITGQYSCPNSQCFNSDLCVCIE